MSDTDAIKNTGERLSFYQLFREKDLSVEIPIIQRDYAQGRNTAGEVRVTFLQALYDYLQEAKPFRDLDFVYGSITISENGLRNFIPLDGQQRLTTLFLLHWYLAQISQQAESFRKVLSKDGRSRFTYETRSSSRDFCDALITNDIDFYKLNTKLSDTIQDRSWFYLSWRNDPTILSMLTMLDAIHDRFASCPEYFDRLVDRDKPVITFLFLNLDKFGLTDDLYIKMNARGKPLTDFENFKARLEKKIKADQGALAIYRLPFKSEPVSAYEYFIHKIDTDWADFFWTYRNEATKDNTYDDELMNFIAQVIANFHLRRADIDSKSMSKVLLGSGGKINRLSFVEYERLACFSPELLAYLISMFDLLQPISPDSKHLMPHLEKNAYYNEEEVIKKVLKNESNYTEKLRFYAFYAGLQYGKGNKSGELLSWMRVVFNLTENTIINDADEYRSVLQAINVLAENECGIIELLQQDVPVEAFKAKDFQAQVFEEKVKAHLLTKSSEWESLILQVEAHSLFKGQIGFILKFAGIIDYYREHKNTNWVDSDKPYFINFKRYADSASALFSCMGGDSGAINYAWERAVLSKGDYLTTTSANRYNLLSSRSPKNNIPRDHSWKRLLRLSLDWSDLWNKRQSYVNAVLDDPDFNANKVQEGLEIICKQSVKSMQLTDWRVLLIKRPALYGLCNQGFIVRNDEEVVLLHESQRNHYHSELFSRYLYELIIDEAMDVTPFQGIEYVSVRSGEDTTYIELADFIVSDQKYSLEIFYDSENYYFCFYNVDSAPCSDKISKILKSVGFTLVENWEEYDPEYWDGYEAAYVYKCEKPEQARKELAELCGLLKGVK